MLRSAFRPWADFSGCASGMRLSVEYNVEYGIETAASRALGAPPDPAAPDLSFLSRDLAAALRSFFETMDRVTADNPVETARLQQLAGKARVTALTDAETHELQSLKLQALRQGRAIGATIGFFLKFNPYPMLERSAGRGPCFSPRSVPCSSWRAPLSATCSNATRSSPSSHTASR